MDELTRSRWIAAHVLPHEREVRGWLRRNAGSLTLFRLSGTYFDISYEDRIGTSANPTSLMLANPNAYPEAVSFSPTVEQIEEALRHSRVTLNTLGIVISDPYIRCSIA